MCRTTTGTSCRRTHRLRSRRCSVAAVLHHQSPPVPVSSLRRRATAMMAPLLLQRWTFTLLLPRAAAVVAGNAAAALLWSSLRGLSGGEHKNYRRRGSAAPYPFAADGVRRMNLSVLIQRTFMRHHWENQCVRLERRLAILAIASLLVAIVEVRCGVRLGT